MKLILNHIGLVFALTIFLFVAGFGYHHSADEKRAKDVVEGLTLAFDSTGTAVIVADKRGKIRFWTSGAEDLFGYTTEEALGENIKILMPKSLQPAHAIAFKEAFQSGDSSVQEINCVAVLKDGNPKLIKVSMWRTEQYAYAIVSDPSKVKHFTSPEFMSSLR